MKNKIKPMTISPSEARRFLIHYQGLDSSGAFMGERGILEFIKKVGCIQYDPLNVVGRNPDLVLQSRIPGYSPDMLEKMLYTDRTLLDGWDKMMAIYLREDWPYFQRLRKRKGEEVIWVLKHRNSSEALNLTGEVREILVQKGPLPSTKLQLGAAGKGRWGHRNLAGAAMDYMFNIGELGIWGKKNSQKIYDLIENLLPRELLEAPDPFPRERDFLKWYVKRRIGSIGLLWGRNGGGWLGQFLGDKELRSSILAELVEEKSLLTLTIKGIDETFYLRPEDSQIFDSMNQVKEKTIRFLAPLDNLLWDRELVEKVFGFTYSWEVYLPADKRKYGYYVLPVLYGDQLVARFEPEQHKGKGPLIIKNWWWEEGVKVTAEMKAAVDEGLQRFCEYLRADGIER